MGNFSLAYASSAIAVGSHTITYSYAGNGTTLSAAADDTSTTLSVTGGVTNPFDVWVAGASQTGFAQDPNSDGVANGLAWLLGATGPSVASNVLLPKPTRNLAGDLVMTFECLKQANRGTATLVVEYSKDLGQSDPWIKTPTAAVPDLTGTVGNVGFTISASALGLNYNHVVATVPVSAASAGGKLFGRLQAAEP